MIVSNLYEVFFRHNQLKLYIPDIKVLQKPVVYTLMNIISHHDGRHEGLGYRLCIICYDGNPYSVESKSKRKFISFQEYSGCNNDFLRNQSLEAS